MAFKIPTTPAEAVPTQSGSFKFPPSPEEAAKTRASAFAEDYMGGNDPTNPVAARIAEGLSLGGTKPLFGVANAAKEWWAGNDPGAGYTAGETAYDEAMKPRVDKAGWTGTVAHTAASIPPAVALTMAGMPVTLTGGLSGAAYNANDPVSAGVGFGAGAALSKLGDWGLNKLTGMFRPSTAAIVPHEGPPVPIPPAAIPHLGTAAANIERAATTTAPNFLRRGAAAGLRQGADILDSELVKYGSMANVLPSILNQDVEGAVRSAAAAGLRPVLSGGLRKGADLLAAPVQSTAPGALKTLMNPANQGMTGPTRDELARQVALGLINSGPVDRATKTLQGGW